MRLSILAVSLFISCNLQLRAQSLSDTTVTTSSVYFRVGYSIYQPNFRNNAQAIEAAVSNIASAQQTDPDFSVTVTGSTSPDGSYRNNMKLAQKRTDTIKDLLFRTLEERGMGSALSHISVKSNGIDWNGLADLTDGLGKDWSVEMSDVLRNCPLFKFDSKGNIMGGKFELMQNLNGGKPYSFMKENLFPEVRKVQIDVISVAAKKVEEEVEKTPAVEPEYIPVVPEQQPVTEVIEKAEPVVERPYELRKFMAVKTNLAFDLATILNLEVEIPFAKRYSINFEYDCPWWVIDDGDGAYCFQGNAVQIEGRFWFPRKNTTNQWALQALNGFFAGIYGGNGRYDIQNYDEGWRGEFWNVGLGVGYSANVSKHINFEFEVGFGLTTTQFETYKSKKHNTILAYQDTRKSMLFYPSRAHVSLVYSFYGKKYRK